MDTRALPAAAELCRDYDLLPQNGHIVCAVSGGADSVCLLHWLNSRRGQYGFRLTAAHYNHGLRGEESNRDEAFVRSFLSKCCPDVPLVVGSGDVAAQAARDKAGIEETAREMRYAFLRHTARSVGADVIATAHNANDNAETILLHLIRGSGLQGLTGIAPKRGDLIRPLLTTERSAIEAYLRIYGLPHVEDSSNGDERFARNRVRRQLMPLLRQMQPQLLSHMTHTARLLEQDEAYLTGQATQLLSPVHPIPGGLWTDAAPIAAQPDALAARMVRILLHEVNKDGGKCSAPHLRAIVSLCRGADPSAQLSLPDGLVARRVYDRLELVQPDPQDLPAPCQLPLPGELTLPRGTIRAEQTVYDGSPQTPCSFFLSCVQTQQGLIVRSRLTGDTLARPNRVRRTLKKILIDEKIPSHTRNLLPVLDCRGRVAAVAGLGPDADFLAVPGEPCWHIVCTPQ